MVIFAIHQHDSAMGAHVSLHPEPPSHLPPHPISVLCQSTSFECPSPKTEKKKIQQEKRLYVDLKKIQYTSWEHYLSLKLYCITLPSNSSHVWLSMIGLCPILSSFKLATVFIANQHSEFTRALMDLDQ